MPLSVFKAQTKSILSSRWFDVRSIAAWAITKSGLWDTTWKAATAARNKLVLRNEKYIDLQALDKMASEVLQHLKEQATSYTTSVFEKDSAVVSIRKEWPRLSTDDVSVILTYLSRDKAMLAVDDIYVKIYGPRVAGPISEKDRAVVNLKTVIGQVSVRVDRLSLRIGEDTSRAKDAIKRNNNALAKYALRSKKSVEASQTKSLEMLENLEMVLTKIDEASDQLEIVNALQSGATILASLNAEVGGAERLSELMDNVRDHVDETDEIGREIASLTADHIDDDEVDEELEALTKDKTTTKERAEDLFAALPAPPTQQPKVPDEPTVEDLSNELEAMQV
jgi:charged multivesicular body protein 7